MRNPLVAIAGFVIGIAAALAAEMLIDERSVILGITKRLGSSGNDHFELAKASVQKLLTDPYTAQFHELRGAARGTHKFVCGTVNAKNRMGGYTGKTPFSYDVENGAAYIVNSPVSAFEAGEWPLRPCYPSIEIPLTLERARELERAR